MARAALTLATGWAGVEAGYHYPSDTLVGAAVGNFFGNFFSAAFLAPDSPGAPGPHVQVRTVPGGAELALQVRY